MGCRLQLSESCHSLAQTRPKVCQRHCYGGTLAVGESESWALAVQGRVGELIGTLGLQATTTGATVARHEPASLSAKHSSLRRGQSWWTWRRARKALLSPTQPQCHWQRHQISHFDARPPPPSFRLLAHA
jgi:hypothetical protein